MKEELEAMFLEGDWEQVAQHVEHLLKEQEGAYKGYIADLRRVLESVQYELQELREEHETAVKALTAAQELSNEIDRRIYLGLPSEATTTDFKALLEVLSW